jgi:hypothetical protein
VQFPVRKRRRYQRKDHVAAECDEEFPAYLHRNTLVPFRLVRSEARGEAFVISERYPTLSGLTGYGENDMSGPLFSERKVCDEE